MNINETIEHLSIDSLRVICASLALAVGILVVLGWHADIAMLTKIHPSFAPMAYNTALGFITSGFALLFINKRFVPVALGLFIFFLGLLTVAEYTIDLSLGIDQIVFDESGDMAPNTALCFVLSGLCLVLASFTHKNYTVEIVLIIVAIIVFLLGCIAFLGYLLTVPSTYGWGSLTAMAVHTAIGFVLLGLGLIAYGVHHMQENGKPIFSITPLFALLIGIVVSVMLWQYLVLREERDVWRSIRITQDYFGDYVQDIIQHQEFVLFEILFDFSHEPGMQLTPKISAKVHQGYPYVAGLGTVDPDGTIYWGMSLENKDATKIVEDTMEISRDFDGVSAQSMEVPGVGRGYIMVLPYYEDDIYLGSVFSVYNSKEVFGNLLSPSMLDNFGVSIYEEGALIYQNVDINEEVARRQWIEITEIDTGARSQWELRTWPRSKLIREIYSWAPNVVFVVALFLFTTLAIIIQLGINLRVSNKHVKQASKAKSDFLSSMSHELRTPLNAIMGYAQLLEYGKNLDQTEKDNAGKIRGAGRHLLSLINDILDLSKIEAGKVEMSIESIALDDIVKECYTLSLPLAEKFGIKLNFQDYESDLYVKADYFRLKQIILNLVSNAIKYNRKDGAVTILAEPVGERIRIAVQDIGNGMSEDQIKNLFQPFERLQAEKSNVEGTGIGLVITKNLVEKMQGSIAVTSEIGVGTNFTIELQLGDKSQHATSVLTKEVEAHKNMDKDSAQKFLILVAEDNPANQEVVTQQLGFLGYKCEIVNNGEEAYNAWKKHDYDLILMDCNMPKLDGYETTQKIRGDETNKDLHIPIVAFTANALKDDIKKCLVSGMDDYVTKPVELEALQNKLSKHLGIVQVITTSETNNGAMHMVNDYIDFSAIEKFVGTNKDAQEKIYAKFLESCPGIKEDILAAYQDKDVEQVRAHSHKLKSSARAVGANKLADLCLEIETAAKENNMDKMNDAVQELNEVSSASCEAIKSHG